VQTLVKESPLPWLHNLGSSQDLGIVVQADTLEDLFERAASGMFTFITDSAEIQCSQTDYCVVTANGYEELLGRWLRELNHRSNRLHEVYREFHIEELTETRLTAMIRGERINPGRHIIYGEIKAIPQEHLWLEKPSGRWEAQIVFEI
jgi:SHS2 domain-containing protein